jgi:hypothetical protein
MNHTFVLRAVLTASISAVPLLADFTYDQTSQLTGGAILQVMHMASLFSKNSRKMTQPILTTVSIKGNRMIRKTADEATVIDLDQQTITTIHYAEKKYSVTTFEQLKQQMAAMAEKAQSSKTQQQGASFDVKVNDTGQTKTVNGNSTHEMVMTMTASGTDAKSGDQGALNIVSDMWIAPNVAGYGEVRDFQRRMAETLGWVPGQSPLINRPDMVKAMSEFYKQGSKLDGMPLATTVRMGGSMQATPESSSEPQPAQESRQNAAPAPASVGEALTGALGGRFGLGRRKKQQAKSETADPEPSAQKASSNQSEASLMEMKSEVTNYNSGTVDPALFQVPSDFVKVDEDLTNPRKHR